MTVPPATYTAKDGTRWEYYDYRVVAEPGGSQRHEPTKLSSDHAQFRAFRCLDRPELGKLTYRYKAPFDYRETDPKLLEHQIAHAIAMREAGKVS